MVLMQEFFFSKIKGDYVQTNYNEVVVLQRGDVLLKHFLKKVSIHIRAREMSGKMKRLKRRMEVQVITLNYCASA